MLKLTLSNHANLTAEQLYSELLFQDDIKFQDARQIILLLLNRIRILEQEVSTTKREEQ